MKTIVASTVLAGASVVQAISLPLWTESISSRASEKQNETTIPAAISIAPSQYWDGDDGPWSSFALQIGTGSTIQNIRALISTEYNNVITVSPDGCPSIYGPGCTDARGGTFNTNQSLTYVANSRWDVGVDQNLGIDIDADAGFDTVTLGWQGSNAPTVSHTIIFDTVSPVYWIGAFGIRPIPTNFSTYVDPQPSFLQQLSTAKKIPSLSWAYTAGNRYRNDQVYGSLTFGGYDKSRFTATNVTFPFYEDNSRELLVNLHHITTDGGHTSNLLPDGNIAIVLDSTVAGLYLPSTACDAFEQAFGLTFDTTYNHYLINATQHAKLKDLNANVTFTIGPQSSGGSTVDIVLPYGAFDLNLTFPNVLNPNSSYYFPLVRAANESQYTLGRTFFQEAYVITDHERRNFTVAPCQWDPTILGNQQIVSILRANETSSSGSTSSITKSSSLSGGAIAGIVIGVLAVLAILLILALILLRRRRNHRKQLAELEAKTAGETNSTGDATEGKPHISAPIGGELDNDGQIHELTAPHKVAAQEMDSPYKMADPGAHGYAEMGGGDNGVDYFGPGKTGGMAEVVGSTPIYEMPGSDVHEMPTPEGKIEERRDRVE